ncbi:hypothetical protein CspHIS471_0609200 [Cutaneotrichosporon sp. HIS471]|nr:hypothetical protein CspHIS471_0609200 [Cutaneotrichosporon sp. HIS471]
MLAILAILLLSTVLAAPRYDTYTLSWETSGLPIGVWATFGTGEIYNYTRVPDGTPVVVGSWAPKFFWNTLAGNIGSPGELRIRYLGITQCVDAGGGWDGEIVRIQKCTGKWDQQWILEGNDKQVRLANSNMCLDVTDGDEGKPVQVWSCHKKWHKDYKNQQWTTPGQ